jgi:hypothetical protein
MVLAVAGAAVPLIVASVREVRRIKAAAMVAGQLDPPKDDSVRLAAVLRPGVVSGEVDEAFARLNRGPATGLLTEVRVDRPVDERAVLLTIPARVVRARAGVVGEIESHLTRSEIFDTVGTLRAS